MWYYFFFFCSTQPTGNITTTCGVNVLLTLAKSKLISEKKGYLTTNGHRCRGWSGWHGQPAIGLNGQWTSPVTPPGKQTAERLGRTLRCLLKGNPSPKIAYQSFYKTNLTVQAKVQGGGYEARRNDLLRGDRRDCVQRAG